MNRQSPLILLLLVAYIFLPTVLNWLTDASSGWYKPFIVWMGVVIGAYLMQKRNTKHDP